MLYYNNIEFLHFLYVLKFKLDIEHQICQTNSTTQTFNKFMSNVPVRCGKMLRAKNYKMGVRVGGVGAAID